MIQKPCCIMLRKAGHYDSFSFLSVPSVSHFQVVGVQGVTEVWRKTYPLGAENVPKKWDTMTQKHGGLC
jgi:hypothetical protein